jgi:hypothetical protein
VSDRRTPDATLISALRILASDIQSGDGCANACLLEAARRLEELVEERRSISTLLQKVESLEAQIARLREERRWIEDRVVISRETFDKVVAALSRCTIVANDDGEEWNDEEVIDARDSIRRDAEKPLPPRAGGDGNG